MQIDNYIIGTLAFNQEPLLIWSCQFFHHLVPPLPKLHRSHNVPPTVASVWTASAAWTASASGECSRSRWGERERRGGGLRRAQAAGGQRS